MESGLIKVPYFGFSWPIPTNFLRSMLFSTLWMNAVRFIKANYLNYLAHCNSQGIKILGSFRPHLSCVQGLSSPQILEVRANESDLKKYVAARLKEKGNKIPELEDQCLQLTKGVDGM
jgi:hypothetical protein